MTPEPQQSATFSEEEEKSPLLAGDAGELSALTAILEGTIRHTGEEFFQSLVRHLAAAVGVSYAFVAEFADTNTRVRTLAYWSRDHIRENAEFELAGTPCAEVLGGTLCHFPRDVLRLFPNDQDAVELKIESYLGVPLLDARGDTLGHLAVFDDRPMPPEPKRLYMFRIFAARAAAELERLRIEKMLRGSEGRFRDLYEEAPIAYVQEDLQSRFFSANRAAMRILGLKPEEVSGTVGMSFIPETSDTQNHIRLLFASLESGKDAHGTVLELRRRDNGQPIWIQWWSRPECNGRYTRTMFVDITDRVLAEQERNRLQQQNAYLIEEIKSVHNFEEIIGRSPALSLVLDKVRMVARRTLPC